MASHEKPVALAVLLLTAVAGGPRPEKPFSVFVTSSAKGDPKAVAAVLEGQAELEKRLRKEDEWFRLVATEDEAEITVDLFAYWVHEEMRSHWETRAGGPGGATHDIEVNQVERHHNLQSYVTILGDPREMTGAEINKDGGGPKGAAKDLMEQLKRHCRDHYDELALKRK